MSVEEAIAIFSSYHLKEKEEFLAHLAYELTIIARDSYEAGENGLTNPRRVRRINEIQHRLSAFLWALLRNDSQRYPDEVLVRIVLEQTDDSALERQISEAFTRLTTQRLTTA
jgi:hypothetical protein